MSEEIFRIALDGGQSVTAVRVPPAGAPGGWTLIYAPGAGSNLKDRFGRALSEAFAAGGVEVVRFQFPYVEERRKFPDRPAVLEATWRAVIHQVRGQSRLAVGGRSMGGRIASHVVASGTAVDALLLFAYPLHPPGQPEDLRTKHLPAVTVPTLFCSGTADEFGTVDELQDAASLVPGSRLHLLAGADHGFGPARGTSGTRRAIFEDAVRAASEFIRGIGVANPGQ